MSLLRFSLCRVEPLDHGYDRNTLGELQTSGKILWQADQIRAWPQTEKKRIKSVAARILQRLWK
jgi:hypothetical protein